MMKWSDIPDIWQNTLIVCVAASAVIGFGFRTFQTIEAAEYQQQTQATETRAGRIDEIRRDIDDKRYQLLATNLNDAQREYLNARIRDLENKIACIQSGRENC